MSPSTSLPPHCVKAGTRAPAAKTLRERRRKRAGNGRLPGAGPRTETGTAAAEIREGMAEDNVSRAPVIGHSRA